MTCSLKQSICQDSTERMWRIWGEEFGVEVWETQQREMDTEPGSVCSIFCNGNEGVGTRIICVSVKQDKQDTGRREYGWRYRIYVVVFL